MVMQDEGHWPALYERWERKHAEYQEAQQAVDHAMSSFLEAKGPAPSREAMKRVASLRGEMFEAREAINAFIGRHANERREKHNLPHHGG